MSLVLNCQSQFAAKLTCGFMLHDYLETMEVIERTLSLYCAGDDTRHNTCYQIHLLNSDDLFFIS